MSAKSNSIRTVPEEGWTQRRHKDTCLPEEKQSFQCWQRQVSIRGKGGLQAIIYMLTRPSTHPWEHQTAYCHSSKLESNSECVWRGGSWWIASLRHKECSFSEGRFLNQTSQILNINFTNELSKFSMLVLPNYVYNKGHLGKRQRIKAK